MIFKFRITVLFVMFALVGHSQNFNISNGSITTCSGVFLDDDLDGGNYSNSAYSYTICPDTPGDVIQVEFVAFVLAQNPNPNNSDYLTIFDGDNTGEDSMGSYTGSSIAGLTFTGTVSNTSGCLTFLFQPNTNSPGAGGWQGNIACTTPCSEPTGIGSIIDPTPNADNEVSVCLDEPISFIDNGSSPGPGFTLENFIWNFGDGTTSEGPADVTHEYTEPGEYIVTLTVEDNNGCQNANLVPLKVLVSTEPVFNSSITDPVCLGGIGTVDVSPIENVTWTALPPQVVSGESYLADVVGAEFESSLLFNYFEDGAVLESCEDLQGIGVNIEHSYIGDLYIELTCPNGTSVVIHDQGGGSIYVGEPVDIEGDPAVGVGYEYIWAPDATNGTWDENGDGGQSLPAGTYESLGNLCDLVGCPLNGEWTLGITDNLAADDGTVFAFSLDLNPELIPGLTTFTPTVGTDSDSLFIVGPNVVETSADGNVIQFETTELGELEYEVTAINNFGCESDTTIFIQVVGPPEITLEPSLTGVVCESFQLEPDVSSDANSGTFDLLLNMQNVQGNFLNGSDVSVSINGTFDQVYSWFGDDDFEIEVENGDVIELTYIESDWGEELGNQVTLYDEYGNVLFQSEESPQNGVMFSGAVFNGLNVSWSPSTGLDNPNILNPSGDFQGSLIYALTVYPEGFEECAVTSEVEIITEDTPNLGTPTVAEYCEAELADFEMIDVLEGNPDNAGTWQDANGNDIDGTFEVGTDDEGLYYYVLNVGECDLSTELEVIIHSLSLTEPNDTIICENGTAILNAETVSTEYADAEIIWNGGLLTGNNISVQPVTSPTAYEAVAIYNNGACQSNTVDLIVTTRQPLQMFGLTNETICLGDSVSVSASNPIGGLEPYTFVWTSSSTSQTGESVYLKPFETTTYCVEMTDACESTPAVQCMDVNLNPIISALFNADNTFGCAPITTSFTGTATDETIISSVVWDFGDGGTANSVNAANHTYSESGLYDVSLTITGTDGCVYEQTSENMVNAYVVPEAEFYAVEPTVVLPNTTFIFENLSTDNDFNTWTFDSYGESTEENPEFEFPLSEPADLEVQLVVSNVQGCVDTANYNIFISNGFSLYAPTSFTPDGDGINEVWKVEAIDVDENDFQMTIYNRDGHAVFSTNDYKSFWDGSYNGGSHYVPNGVYTYQILTRARTSGDKEEILGTITLLR